MRKYFLICRPTIDPTIRRLAQPQLARKDCLKKVQEQLSEVADNTLITFTDGSFLQDVGGDNEMEYMGVSLGIAQFRDQGQEENDRKTNLALFSDSQMALHYPSEFSDNHSPAAFFRYPPPLTPQSPPLSLPLNAFSRLAALRTMDEISPDKPPGNHSGEDVQVDDTDVVRDPQPERTSSRARSKPPASSTPTFQVVPPPSQPLAISSPSPFDPLFDSSRVAVAGLAKFEEKRLGKKRARLGVSRLDEDDDLGTLRSRRFLNLFPECAGNPTMSDAIRKLHLLIEVAMPLPKEGGDTNPNGSSDQDEPTSSPCQIQRTRGRSRGSERDETFRLLQLIRLQDPRCA
ncbi:hypothetical protein CROQUDRAFT_102914 [Cronartium quercuum f. sp. fusiforme G11]|uniref:Uncharacterized protein n=1 Tax=Cronartium quercuum f. sp. fusiforme G11 TaxID=708437 RepID=A0A9P6NZU1_9BASI|nr:hypothetical protein CROQUDRAFT_102914 [Cronartium quercuum f. sp. fusiforme G11]